jgi:hypothetical protein
MFNRKASSHCPYEMRFGVTGHRAPKTDNSAARIEVAVRRLLDRVHATLHRKYSLPMAWTIVSPLARGADRIVTGVVLERPDSHLDVVIPFDLEEYRRDFGSQDDLAEFDGLLFRGRNLQVNPLPNVDGDLSVVSKEDRDEGYVRVGESVVDSGEILIAVWDGEPSQGQGGTADVVRYAADRGRVVLWIDAVNPEAPPRVVESVQLDGEALTTVCRPFPERAEDLSSSYCQQGAYCADGGLSVSRFHRALAAQRAWFKQAVKSAGLPVARIMTATGPILNEFVRADVLATGYQRLHLGAVNGILLSAAVGVTAALVQQMFLPGAPWLTLIEIAAMVAVLTCWLCDRRLSWHQKWLHDRYLAERLRTALFTTVARLGREQEQGDPLPFYRGPRHWLNDVVDRLRSDAAESIRELPLSFESLKKFLTNSWIADQKRFHERNAKRQHRNAVVWHRIGVGLFVATLLLAILHYIQTSGQPSASRWTIGHLEIAFLAIILPVWAGTIHAVAAQLELERIAERSGRMSRVLARVAHRMQYVHDGRHLRSVAKETAELMKVENHEWWVLLSFQDVRLQA